ncbi:MAG TPA: GNAT family N-acetyltransferase [Polyangiaceae bacterium]|nr:GNAT family N-acetyltransferase [Polyangiaceae bacterium]
MRLQFRPATPADSELAAPLIHSSGPAAFDYVFDVVSRAGARDFLRHAFADGPGEFGFRNHTIVMQDDQVVAVGAAWSGRSTLAFTLAAGRQILSVYGPLSGPGVVVRGLRVETVIQPPARSCWYVGHLAVAERWRGHGIGAALVDHLLARGREQGFAHAALDVAVTNPHAERLYARLGFATSVERISQLKNARAAVANHRRMERAIAAAPSAP